MKRSEVFPSDYLKTDDVSGEGEKYSIKEITLETFTDPQSGEETQKPVVWFKESEKGLILNKTNWDRIESQHGKDSNSWTGKKVKLRLEEIEAFGKKQDAIRVAA